MVSTSYAARSCASKAVVQHGHDVSCSESAPSGIGSWTCITLTSPGVVSFAVRLTEQR